MRPRRAGFVAVLLSAVLCCGLLATPAASVAAGKADGSGKAGKAGKKRHKKKKRPPKPKPVYWGAWIGSQLTGTDAPWDMNAVAQFEAIIGKSMSLIQFSSPFLNCNRTPCEYYEFPTPAMNNVRAHGSIPVFSWGPESSPSPGPEQPDFQLADIAGGAHDAYIHQFAAEARDWGAPFFLRFAWEMNGNWFPWSETANGNTPGQYVAAWRRVHDIFEAVGATNATWIWCPYADTPSKLRQYPLKQAYPGHRYVDWTCLDGYNWGSNAVNPRPWRSFSEILDPAYKAVTKKIAPRKPLMLGEFATTPNGGSKGLWIRKMFESLPRRYPRIRALIYFNEIDRGVDWPLETHAAATWQFAKGISKGRYLPNRFGGITTSPILPVR